MMIRAIIAILLALVMSSCATYWSGSFSSNLAITPDQYRVIELANGEAKTLVFLGIFGGNSHDNLVLEAKNNLIKNYPLDSNMIFANWSVSFKNQWHIFGFTQICDIRAEIIGLKPGVNYPQKPFIMKTRKVVPLTRPMMKGDSVSFMENGKSYMELY